MKSPGRRRQQTPNVVTVSLYTTSPRQVRDLQATAWNVKEKSSA